MKSETIAIHGGYETDPATKAVAVPIYQTVAYEFDSADHAAALFNLEVDGYRYTRIGNPTTAVLERRVAELEGGVAALCVSSGQAAVHYAVANLTELGTNIVSTPQLYGTTHTLFAHLLPNQGVTVRFAASDRPEAIERLIDAQTRAVYCETVGNPASTAIAISANESSLQARRRMTSASCSGMAFSSCANPAASSRAMMPAIAQSGDLCADDGEAKCACCDRELPVVRGK